MYNFSLLIKPASADCNLRCDYCFYIDHLSPEKTRMSAATLEAMVQAYMSVPLNHYAFAWQGGEPTLMGLDFFKEAVALQRKYLPRGSSFSNSIQTNGTLITGEMARFFTEHNFLAGISLDGPETVHDMYRRNSAGQGSHRWVMKGIDTLRRNNTEFNILTLVHSGNVGKPAAVYKYLKSKSFYYHQYIPCVEYKGEEPLPWTITAEEWGDFLIGIFNQWKRKDVRRVSIRFFDSILHKLVHGNPTVCSMDKSCIQYFVVEYNGDVYPCDFFVRDSLKLGSVHKDSMDSLLESKKYHTFGEEKMNFDVECHTCPYLDFCYGGCQKERIGGRKTVLCEGYKAFYQYALPFFEKLTRELK